MCFIERENTKFYSKIYGNFPMERNSAQGPRNEIWLKSCFSVKFMGFFEEKWYMLWLTGIFLYFWRVWRFFAILHSPFKKGETALEAILPSHMEGVIVPPDGFVAKFC